MSTEATTLPTERRAFRNGQNAAALVGIAIVLTALQYSGLLPGWLHRLPEAVIPNFAQWLDAAFTFIKDDLGLLALTRFLTEGLE